MNGEVKSIKRIMVSPYIQTELFQHVEGDANKIIEEGVNEYVDWCLGCKDPAEPVRSSIWMQGYASRTIPLSEGTVDKMKTLEQKVNQGQYLYGKIGHSVIINLALWYWLGERRMI